MLGRIGDARECSTARDGASARFDIGKALARRSDLLQPVNLDRQASGSQRLVGKVFDQAALSPLDSRAQPTTRGPWVGNAGM